MFRKVLIANRGEIAVRVIRSCRELGLKTVAVYSPTDARSPHTLYADEAVLLEGHTAAETYLNQNRILDVARERQADTIHPGYGFLSENADFAEACIRENIAFIGPNPKSIREMGDKTRARELMKQAGIPIPPGTRSTVITDDEAIAIGDNIGYPVLIKAAAGGGGKGMRKVASAADLPAALKAARSESAGAFGDDRVYIEKYLQEPRHVEFQIFADSHGNCVHLFDRECSIQRRHQKLVEEAPSPLVDEKLRTEMGQAAVRVAKSCGYVGAGTVEFLVDSNRRYYFLEMNTRLQVEHPVTEMITGLDLVALQIRIAEGHPLPWKQEEVRMQGHAIECRICAENPIEQFLPATGTVRVWRPASGASVRVDEGIRPGQRITTEYDPLIAKLIVHGNNRQQAISRMIRALDDTVVTGFPTTIPFCRYVMGHNAFREGRYDTHFIPDHFSGEELLAEPVSHPIALIAGLLQFTSNNKNRCGSGGNPSSIRDNRLEPGVSNSRMDNSNREDNRNISAWWARRQNRK